MDQIQIFLLRLNVQYAKIQSWAKDGCVGP